MNTPSALSELNELIGLESVKRQLHEQHKLLDHHRAQALQGHPGLAALNLSAAFYGNPGQYVGQTSARTRQVCSSAIGGVLLVEGISSLVTGGALDFGREALDELLRFFGEHHRDTLIIFIDYPGPMGDFLRGNPALDRRIGLRVHLPDYSSAELSGIARSMARASGVLIDDDALPAIVEIVERYCEACLQAGQAFGNANLVARLVHEASAANTRRAGRGATAGVVAKLTAEDFRSARLDPPGGQ